MSAVSQAESGPAKPAANRYFEEATRLGFFLQFNIRIPGWFWNASGYEGLQEFHQAKGFDPDTQDLVLDKHYPLYRLVSKANRAEDWDADESNYTQTSIDKMDLRFAQGISPGNYKTAGGD
ncbi:hypothetical protein DFH08DRAFT_820309 [Mycena albidolilacea]|uniref:Uncharacterized protein n=1 Tax=Mycena albidolilacea TaxID=1033008 RepID=A0AAD6ZCB2_9AGAR|nr:hypothetical protein DFH08DRAFT_820309 [Mycena albidolilacea]